MEYQIEALRYQFETMQFLYTGANGSIHVTAEASSLGWKRAPNFFVLNNDGNEVSVWWRHSVYDESDLVGWVYSNGDNSLRVTVWND